MSTQLLKKRKKSLFDEIRGTENRQERFMFFVLFCFVFVFLRSACWEFTHKKRGKIENWNGLIHLC